jgi:hypothetical protein
MTRMSASLLASEFPEDPIFILRAGWYFLVAYYVVATVVVFFLWKSLKASRFAHSTKQRLITAAVLAAIFAPSEVSDFFLFNLPGPAAAGLLMLLIAILLVIVSQPGALLTGKFWLGFAQTVGGYYLLPLCVTFVIVYAILWIYSRSRERNETAPL